MVCGMSLPEAGRNSHGEPVLGQSFRVGSTAAVQPHHANAVFCTGCRGVPANSTPAIRLADNRLRLTQLAVEAQEPARDAAVKLAS